MKRLITAALVLIFLAIAGASVMAMQAPPPTQETKPESEAKPQAEPGKSATLRRDFKELPLPVGEKLTYEVKFSRFPIPPVSIGKVSFEFLGLKPAPVIAGLNAEFKPLESDRFIHLRAEAVSGGFLASLFKLTVNDRFETLVDAHDFGARLSFKEIQESKNHSAHATLFDREKQTAKYIVTDLNKPESPPREKPLAISDGTLDLLSAFYFVQLQKLKTGEVLRFPVTNDGQQFQFEIVVGKREKLNTDFGKFNTIKVEPKLFGPGRLFSRAGEMTMWVIDDDCHLPLRLVSKTSAGTITAALSKVEGPKAETKSKKNSNGEIAKNLKGSCKQEGQK